MVGHFGTQLLPDGVLEESGGHTVKDAPPLHTLHTLVVLSALAELGAVAARAPTHVVLNALAVTEAAP